MIIREEKRDLLSVDSKGIKVTDLQYVEVNSVDINSVNELARKLTMEFLLHFIFVLLASIFASFVVYDTIRTNTENLNMEVICFLLIALMFYYVLFYVFKQILSTMKASYKKAQYGIVKSKYCLKASAKNSSPKKYYIDVLFPDTNASIRRVICTNSIYNKLEEGTPVLVVSFDNKNAYAVSSI